MAADPARTGLGWWPFGRRRNSAAASGSADLPERWCVLDVESTGLDAQRDRLIAVAALAVRVPAVGRPRLEPGDSFERVVAPPTTVAESAMVDKPNILLHGIGVGAQRKGQPAREAMEALEQWLDGAPIIGFHVAFDETMLQRSRQGAGLAPLRQRFIDLEHVAEALRPEVKARSLDDWMTVCGVRCEARHQAAADAWATAEVLLHLWPALAREAGKGRPVRAELLARLAQDRKWLTQQGR